MDIPTLNFDHAHHTLKIRGLSSPPDVLSFEGREHLSRPFCYDIQFTSRDKTIEPEAVLMQDGALSLCAPPVQGMPVQMPLLAGTEVSIAFEGGNPDRPYNITRTIKYNPPDA